MLNGMRFQDQIELRLEECFNELIVDKDDMSIFKW